MLVDRYFHSSDFFLTHSHLLKKQLLPAMVGSPVKPFFLGHIALELILDNLLLTTKKVTVDGFYDHLDGCKTPIVDEFLTSSGLKTQPSFLNFMTILKKQIRIQLCRYQGNSLCLKKDLHADLERPVYARPGSSDERCFDHLS